MKHARASLETCRARLAAIWFIGAALLILILLGALVGGKYGSQWPRTWKWFVPTVAPSLGLILSSTIAASQGAEGTATVSTLLFRLAQLVSGFYLLLLLVVEVAAYQSAQMALSLMDSSQLWLGFFQGIVATALGATLGAKKSGG